VALATLLVSLFTIDVEEAGPAFMWGVRIAVALGFVALLYSVLKRPPAVSDDERRKTVVPLSSETCVYCKSALVSLPNLHCPICQIRIYTEERATPAAVYRPIVERIRGKMGGDFRPASESSLAALRRLRLPGPVIAFYGQYEPASTIENEQTIRLLPISVIVENNTKCSVGFYTSPHGYIEFASTFGGDAYCFDVNTLNAEGEPRIVILSHESVSDETTPEEMAKLAKPVAQDLREFLDQFLKGDLDQKAFDYGAAGL
jgi:hypothetical protein